MYYTSKRPSESRLQLGSVPSHDDHHHDEQEAQECPWSGHLEENMCLDRICLIYTQHIICFCTCQKFFSAVFQPNGQLLIHKRYRNGSKYVGFLILFGREVWSESLCVLLLSILAISSENRTINEHMVTIFVKGLVQMLLVFSYLFETWFHLSSQTR